MGDRSNWNEWDKLPNGVSIWDNPKRNYFYDFDPYWVYNKNRFWPVLNDEDDEDELEYVTSDIQLTIPPEEQSVFLSSNTFENSDGYLVEGEKYIYKEQSRIFKDICVYSNNMEELRTLFVNKIMELKERWALDMYGKVRAYLYICTELERYLYNRISQKFGSIQTERERISDELKQEILQKFDFRCAHCKRHMIDNNTILEIDHIIPLNRGGTNSKTNLQALCKECNRKKADK